MFLMRMSHARRSFAFAHCALCARNEDAITPTQNKFTHIYIPSLPLCTSWIRLGPGRIINREGRRGKSRGKGREREEVGMEKGKGPENPGIIRSLFFPKVVVKHAYLGLVFVLNSKKKKPKRNVPPLI